MAGVLAVGEPTPTAMASSPGEAEVVEVAERSGDVRAGETQLIAIEDDPTQMVVLIMVGLAVGLGVAAMMTVLRFRMADRSQV